MERSTLIPVEEYLSTSYRPDREYVDGTLVERNVGERDHSELQMALSAYLFNRRRELNIHVFPEQRVQVKATRFRVPDVCVVTGDKPREQILTSPPFLCVEILSKDDRMSEMQERIDDYLSFGVRSVWVIDPRTKRAYVHTLEGIRETKDALRTQNPDIVVPLDELFAQSRG
jgi:Uma2 family endonuclease